MPALGGLEQLRRDACPRDLPPLPGFEFPHLIVPISKAQPDVANPNSFSPSITANDIATVFNFDIVRDNQDCELGFYFPRLEQLNMSSFSFSGTGTFTTSINQPGTGAQDGVTTWNNQPAAGPYAEFPKTITMSPGNYYSLWIGACPVGLWSITVTSPDTLFQWFQSYASCPIGPYVTYSG